MRENLDLILKAINLANFDGLKVVEVDVADLLLLRATINDQQKVLMQQTRELHVLSAKVALKQVEKPIHLRMYA